MLFFYILLYMAASSLGALGSVRSFGLGSNNNFK